MGTQSETSVRPWVSFCLTTRRRPDFLKATLQSIQRQTVQDFEVIVSDNDPAGSARIVIESLCDMRFCHYCNESDLGMIPSFNRSLERARGEFVVMITDDDPIYPEMLQVLKELTQKHPGFGAYFGGADVLQLNPAIARLTLHKIGTNSCLAQIPYGAVRTYTSENFPHAYLGDEVGMYLLWSVGMSRREIAQSIGVPDYGSPYMGDYAYTISICSRSGCVITNRAVGCQTVHDFNYGRKECGELKTAALGFTDFMTKRFSTRPDWSTLKPKLEKFTGQWLVLHSLFLSQYFREFNIKDHNLKSVLPELFKIPYVRRLRHYYYLGRLFMRLQRAQVDLRNYMLHRMRKSA